MPYTRDIVVLTKSAKNHANCVAGIDINTGKWIRLVKDIGEINDMDMICSNGHKCEPLDVVRISFITPRPNGCQTENEKIDTYSKWNHLGTLNLQDVLELHPAENYPNIFGNYKYTLNEDEKNSLCFSLMLIEVLELEFYTIEETGKTKASFIYSGYKYRNMSVTDRDYFGNEDSYSHAYLVMSIPNATPPGYNYFKFIAKVFIE